MGVQRAGRARLSSDARADPPRPDPPRAGLDARQVAELAREIDARVRGARVKDVVALPPSDVVLVLEKDGERATTRVRLSADADAPRLHVQHERVERHEGPVGPFFRRIERELAGAVVAEVAQVAGDRVVLVELREAPAGERRALVLELFGRHANVVLLGRDDVVVDLLVPAKPTKPGQATKGDARLVAGKAWSPPRLAGKTTAPSDADPWADLRARATERKTDAPLSWLVESALGAHARDAHRAREARRVVERVERRLQRARSLVHGLEQRLAASAEHERVRRDGELLKANLARVARGAKSLEVDDFFDENGAKRTLALDPKLSPQENLARLFERAKKLERATGAVEGELAIARETLAAVEELRARFTDDADADALEAEAVARGLLEPPQPTEVERRKAEPAARLPYKVFHGLRGSEIRVGRTAKDNDDLTFRHANGNDVWLHTADTPGSHVVLRIEERGREPDPEELVDAAHLAVQFSPLKGATRARVHVARRKEVHKPRGAKPGLVTLSGGRILELRMQPDRLQRLLGTHRPPGAS